MVALNLRKAKSLLLTATLLTGLIAPATVSAAGGSVTANLGADPSVACGQQTTITLTIDGQNPPPEQQVVDTMLVLDKSGSMGPAGMAALKNSANSFVDRMDNLDGSLNGTIANSRVGVVAFDNVATLRSPLTHNAVALKTQINALTHGGGTAIGSGIDLAQAQLSSSPNKKVMIVMTDGINNAGPNPLTSATAAKAAGTEIFTIGLGTNIDEPQLIAMATTPNHYYRSPTNADLQAIFEAIATLIQQPAGTDLRYSVTVAAPFELVSASATAGYFTHNHHPSFDWHMNEIGTESVTITYTIQHTGSTNGLYPIHDHAMLTWIDDERRAMSANYIAAQIQVVGCNLPPTADAGPDQTVPMDLSGFATVLLDGTASTDDGQMAPLTYDWYLGAIHIGSGATLPVALPLGVHTIDLVIFDGEFSDSDSVTITVEDRIAPTSAIATDCALPGNAGWCRSAVTVAISAADNFMGSGLDAIYYAVDGGPDLAYSGPFVVTGDGAHSVSAYATDLAGNVEIPISTGFMIDATAPALAIASPVSAGYTSADTLTISFSASDATSGLAAVTADLNGLPVSNGDVIALHTLGIGSHTLTVTATDNAGNSSTESVTFTVNVTHDSLEALKHILADAGQITNHGIVVSLDQKIRAAKAAHDRGQDRTHDQIMRAFIAEVEAQDGQHITPAAAALLIAHAQWLIDNTN